MLLSIGMIVKDEERHLRNCLNSIKPILEQVSSELIIFDTGSADNTREIAREFTDKVYEIEWRGDFAWARNHTIEKATGQWYMFVDADEKFTDCSDLISFFNSGEYNNFKAATYLWNNFLTDKHTSSFRVTRLFKLEKDTRFVGAIHEYIHANKPIRDLTSIADHHGYNFRGNSASKQEQIQKKFDRNFPPLLKMLEEKPNDLRTIFHITNEYEVVKNYEKTKFHIDQALKILNGNQNNLFYHIFTERLARYYAFAGLPEKAVEVIRSYLRSLEIHFTTLPQLCVLEAISLIKLSRHKEAAQAYEKSLGFYEKNKRGKLNDRISFFVDVKNMFLEDRFLHEKGIIDNYAMAGEFELAFKHLDNVEDESKRKGMNVFVTFIGKAIADKRFSGFAEMFSHALACGEDSERYSKALETIEDLSKNVHVKREIARHIGGIDSDNDYVRLQRLKTAYYDGYPLDELDYFLTAQKEFSGHFGDVIIIAMQHGADFSGFADRLKIAETSKFVARVMSANFDAAETVVTYLRERGGAAASPKCERILSTLAMAVLNGFGTRSEDEKLEMFEVVVRVRHSYLAMVYRPEIYNEAEAASLPEGDGFVFYAGQAFKHYDAGDLAEYARCLRLALRANPLMKEIIIALTERLKQEYAEQLTPEQELAKEVANLKAAIYTMIDAGNTEGAEQILAAYAAINPNDPDIRGIERSIRKPPQPAHFRVKLPQDIKLWWFRFEDASKRNFGDELTTIIIERLFGLGCVYASAEECELIGIGSILHRFDKRDREIAVWGSGRMMPGAAVQGKRLNFLAVRGLLTRGKVPGGGGLPMGDPGLLVNLAFAPGAKTDKIGVVPHFADFNAPEIEALRSDARFMVINPLDAPDKVIAEIASCAGILSSSLHGLITADSFGIPNRRIRLSDRTDNGDYKFNDYASGAGKSLQHLSLAEIETQRPQDLADGYEPVANLEGTQAALIHSLEQWLASR
ncbi:MAG: glycosyltransferase [Defluviitaleaceae bacterium]|nr:glycosyltransferase [Defluviitaleaceae bacterium]